MVTLETKNIIENFLQDGVFGLVTYKDSLKDYPVEKIRVLGISNFEDYFMPFVVVNGKLVFQAGSCEDKLECFNYVNYPNITLKDVPGNYIITHIFHKGSINSFSGIYHELVSWERYHETQNKPLYVSPLLPRALTKQQIEELLGCSIIILDD